MGISLKPSPTAKVTQLPLDLKYDTISALNRGVIPVKITDLALIARWKNMLSSYLSEQIQLNMLPSTTSTSDILSMYLSDLIFFSNSMEFLLID